MQPSRTRWCSSKERKKARRRALHAQAKSTNGGDEVQRLWGVLYADDAGIVSRSSEGLERMMRAIVTACSSFGLTVSEAKTDIMCLETKSGGKVSFTINAVGQVYKQTILFVYFGGAITADRNLSTKITRLLQRALACFQRCKMEIYDRPCVRLRLKVRLLKAEVVETLLYGCMTWSPKKPDYDRLRQAHRSMLLRCLGWRKRKRDDREARRPHPIVRRRARPDRFRER